MLGGQRADIHEIGKADFVMQAVQVAAALETSGSPKPGNVYRTRDFKDTRFEHFLAGSIALGPAMRKAALRGIYVGRGQMRISGIRLGSLVKEAVVAVRNSHTGGNTHLGISLLFAPLASAAGIGLSRTERLSAEVLKRDVVRVIRGTTENDAVDAFEAIRLASSAALGRIRDRKVPDLYSPRATKEIVERKLTLRKIMLAAARWDSIAREWSTSMRVTFGLGYPTFKQVFRQYRDVNLATVHTFLKILSRIPDTFIARKVGVKETESIERAVQIGMKKAAMISKTADRALQLGGLSTPDGRRVVESLDDYLRRRELNPGTSADLTASSILVAVLCGFRP